MSRAGAPKTTQVSIRVPDEVLAQIDELAALMQRPHSFVVVQALRDFIAAELEDARSVAQEVAANEAHPEAGVPHEDVLDWLIEHGALTRDAVEAARKHHAS